MFPYKLNRFFHNWAIIIGYRNKFIIRKSLNGTSYFKAGITSFNQFNSLPVLCLEHIHWLVIFIPNRRTYSYSEPQLYSQNSGGSYFDTQGSSSQVSTVVTSHGMANNGGGGSGGMNMNLAGGQVISGSPGAYIMDNTGPHPATQTARASPATVSV